MLSLEQMTGTDEEKQSKMETHADIMLHFNEQIADNYILYAQDLVQKELPIADGLIISMLLFKMNLTGFCEAHFKGEHDVPTDLRNAGYYSEQVLSQMAHMYIANKQKEAAEANEGV